MSYSMPTVAQLKARHATFSSVDDDVVDEALAEAETMVGSSWTSERAYRTGAMLYAAHILVTWGHGETAEAKMAREGSLTVRSVSDGAVSITRDAGRGDGDTLDLTQFGRQFRDLRQGSVLPVTIAWTK
jgi:hypothetical protein